MNTILFAYGRATDFIARTPQGSTWVVAVSVIHLTSYVAGLGPWVQFPTALAFYLTCPGAIVLDWIRISDLASRLVVVVAISLASNALIAVVLLYLGLFTPLTGLLAIILTAFGFVWSSATYRPRTGLPSVQPRLLEPR